MDDFQFVALLYHDIFQRGPRHDQAVALDSDLGRVEIERTHQIGDRAASRDLVVIAVQPDLNFSHIDNFHVFDLAFQIGAI